MNESIFVRKSGGLFTRVSSRVVILVEASGGCSKIITKEQTYVVSSSLSQLEEILPVALFCRVHRSYIVALEFINSFTIDSIKILDREISLSKTYADQFFSRVKVVF